MNTVNEAVVMSGLSDVKSVAIAHCNRPVDEVSVIATIEAVSCGLLDLINHAETADIADALACAVLNRHFIKSGWFVRVKSPGVLLYEYIASDATRSVMGDAFGL